MYNTNSGKACMNNTGTTSAEEKVKTYAFGKGVVKQGSKGASCMAWQEFLNANHDANLSTDGACGKLTMKHAKLWQKSVGLKADGALGARSRTKALE